MKSTSRDSRTVRPPIELFEEDFDTLGTGCLVNGMVVNAFLRLIERRSMFYHQLPRVLAVSSALLPSWSRGDLTTNDVLAAGAGLDRAKIILFPLHLPQLGPYGHWALLFASLKEGTVTASRAELCVRGSRTGVEKGNPGTRAERADVASDDREGFTSAEVRPRTFPGRRQLQSSEG